jgi:hypothetical protein
VTAEMELVVDADGGVRCIYDEGLDLRALGKLTITRASHVEPNSDGNWWADMAPVGGRFWGPMAAGRKRWLRRGGGYGDRRVERPRSMARDLRRTIPTDLCQSPMHCFIRHFRVKAHHKQMKEKGHGIHADCCQQIFQHAVQGHVSDPSPAATPNHITGTSNPAARKNHCCDKRGIARPRARSSTITQQLAIA